MGLSDVLEEWFGRWGSIMDGGVSPVVAGAQARAQVPAQV